MFLEGKAALKRLSSALTLSEAVRNVCPASSYLPRGFPSSVLFAIVGDLDCGYFILTECVCVCVLSLVHTMANYRRIHMIVHSWMSTKHVYLCCPSINILETAFIGVDLQRSVTETIS